MKIILHLQLKIAYLYQNIYGIILGIQLIFLINLQNILALLEIIIKFYLNILIEEKNNIYFPHLYVTAFVESKFVSYLFKQNSINVEKINLLNKFDLQKEIEFEKESEYIDDLRHIAIKGEILDQDIIAEYIKVLILPEYGGLDDISIQSIFSKV